MLVYSEEKRSFDSNRLHYFEEHYENSDQKVDFSKIQSFEDLIFTLDMLAEQNLHLVGTRGYVYHSKAMSDLVLSYKEAKEKGHQATLPWNLLTRTGGLRAKTIELFDS